MTNIGGARVIGNHAVMGGPVPAAARIPSTVRDILGAGVRRRARRREMIAAQSTWDSEGGQREKVSRCPTGSSAAHLGALVAEPRPVVML
jgi:hypothetical protein